MWGGAYSVLGIPVGVLPEQARQTWSATFMNEKKNDPDLESAHVWLESVSTELGQDPAVIRALVEDLLDLTRDVAHGPSRPAAPLTAFLVGLASGRALEAGAGPEATVDETRETIERVLALLRKA